MYFSVEDLTEEQFEHLRSCLFYKLLDDGSMEEIIGYELDYIYQVPDDLVKTHYADYLFCEDDFL